MIGRLLHVYDGTLEVSITLPNRNGVLRQPVTALVVSENRPNRVRRNQVSILVLRESWHDDSTARSGVEVGGMAVAGNVVAVISKTTTGRSVHIYLEQVSDLCVCSGIWFPVGPQSSRNVEALAAHERNLRGGIRNVGNGRAESVADAVVLTTSNSAVIVQAHQPKPIAIPVEKDTPAGRVRAIVRVKTGRLLALSPCPPRR